ncbi:Predicted restriction endonuclease [Pasteurella multocida]|uniref:HNH endonuclease domain protein n=1 Tax=Pasteurella dagmatis ATCC 43325 TaxID=667128 RepID=C9PPM2_9PAST|nr:HNH endonuclease signature motif containing protein [Pasteurella dagmatis]EEX50323.1 HNH endonuclease domain protein [Pasteurella dagmatis ATCC 43325]SNV57070.1 Predicted restriction endonuclease [Pasteurella dagmatis]VEI58001.1 Predicted restriction endonuclease [Pasteurella multocida]
MDSNDVRRAFKEYNNGKRPQNSGQPKYVFVLNPDDEQLYPLKIIRALACHAPANAVNTRVAAKELRNLGFEAIDIQTNALYPNQNFDSEFDKKVKKALHDSPEKRQKRLDRKKIKKPSYSFVKIRQFHRDPDVVAEVLYQANGVCGACKKPAPFNRKVDNMPYLEVHHKIPLSQNGDDSVSNCIALCPNCHRKIHFGNNS